MPNTSKIVEDGIILKKSYRVGVLIGALFSFAGFALFLIYWVVNSY